MIGGSAISVEALPLDERRRFLGYSEVAVSARDRLVFGGIVRPDIARDLEPDVRLNTLLPHDADLVLERTDPDVVFVESSALLPGNPWAGAGEPSIADVARRLDRVLEVARHLERPTVLWWDCPRQDAAGLLSFERRFDFVLAPDVDRDRVDMAWTAGVQLARFSPLGADPVRPFHPVAHGDWSRQPLRACRRFFDDSAAALVGEDLELWIDAEAVEGARWVPRGHRERDVQRVLSSDLADRYRQHGLFVADPPIAQAGQRVDMTRTMRQLACGARVVSGPNEALSRELGDRIEWAADAAAMRDTVRAAARRGPRGAPELRALLRQLFLGHDTTIAIETLANLIGTRPVVRRRNASVVVEFDGQVRPEEFVDSVILQRFRPREALIAVGDPAAAATAVDELEGAGIASRVLPAPTAPRGLARWAAGFASSDWLWMWSPATILDRHFLLDAVIHGIITGAPAIGRGESVESGFVDGSGLHGLVVSREAANELPDARDRLTETWHDRGARLYAVGVDADGD